MEINNSINRRRFLHSSVLGAGMAAAPSPAAAAASPRLPREVWIASVSQNNMSADTHLQMTDKLLVRAELAAAQNPDIVCLPEVGPFVNLTSGERPPLKDVAETPPGPLTEKFAAFARKHRCYVWAPLYTQQDGKYYNALVLLDRQGKVVGEYHKMHPTPGELKNGIMPGASKPPVFQTDFGVVGAQICYDIEWLDGWQALKDAGAEIVFWSSAFGGGEKLNMLATLFRYVVVSSTRKGVTRICDISGESVAWTGHFEHTVCAPVNLEKAFLHSWPVVHQFDEVRKKYGQAVRLTTFHDEEWSILESRSPDVRIADVLKEFDIQTYDEMVRTSTEEQNRYRRL